MFNRVGRFIIPLDGSPYGKLEAALNPDEHGKGMDMCSINPAYLGRKYRYAFACGAKRPCNFPNTLTKVNFLSAKKKTDMIPYIFGCLLIILVSSISIKNRLKELLSLAKIQASLLLI